MTLEEYLRKNAMRQDPHPVIDHSIRCIVDLDKGIRFYIHPQNANGDTIDFWVNANKLTTIVPEE